MLRKEEEVLGAVGSSAFCPRALSHSGFAGISLEAASFPQAAPKLPWKSLPAKEGVVLSSPVILFNGHSFYNLNYIYTLRHWPFSFGLQSVLPGSQKSGYFRGDKERHEQTVWLGNIAL